jgi:hypothetical protein
MAQGKQRKGLDISIQVACQFAQPVDLQKLHGKQDFRNSIELTCLAIEHV